LKAAVAGTSGYTGLILLRRLYNHPEITEIIPVSSSKAGNNILEIDPGLGKNIYSKMNLTEGKCINIEKLGSYKPDVVFAALPHLKSAELLKNVLLKTVVIDLSADFRIHAPELFRAAYGCRPPREDLLDKAVYGLCEWYKDKIRDYDIIANPGCYPTSVLLPVLPLLKEKAVSGNIIVNSISGISGAGKKLNENLLFCERTENAGAYAPCRTHRHVTEMEGELKKEDSNVKLYFTPHLAPLKQGITSTITADIKKGMSSDEINNIYKKYYGEAVFISIKGNYIPQTMDVRGSNRCDIGWHLDDDKIFVFSCIDNLIKGASGQAVQNMNIRFGIDEHTGLEFFGEA
jgi:N-acetyl-gamma-glutamyl-phosphate reductase